MADLSSVIVAADKPLPLSVDVPLVVTKSQAETVTALTNAVFITDSGPLRHGAGRARVYSSDSPTSVGVDFGADSEAYKAASAFCAQGKKPKQFVIAQVFNSAQSGYATTGGVNQDITAWNAVTDGGFKITVDGETKDVNVTGLNAATTLDEIATAVQTGLTNSGAAGVKVVNNGGVFVITSSTTGEGSLVSKLMPPDTGTNLSSDSFLNGVNATTVPGYTPQGFESELLLVEMAVEANGVMPYGYALDEKYRDAEESEVLAKFCESRLAVCSLTSNDFAAKNPESNTDIGKKLEPFGYSRTGRPEYSEEIGDYPCMAKLARALGTDYNGENTVQTMKFQDLNGISVVGISTSELSVLETKGYDVFTRVGNSLRYTRNGRMVSPSWYWDERIGLDNYAAEAQAALATLLVQRNKLGYNPSSIAAIQNALAPINLKYKRNGLASDRITVDANGDTVVIPSIQVIIQPLETVTPSQRAERDGVSVQIIIQLDGAMHTLPLSVYGES